MKPGLAHGFALELEAIDENGRLTTEVGWVLTEEENGQVLAGYRCLACMEPFRVPWPKECPVCGYHVSDRQSADYFRQHQGEQQMGATPLDKIAERDAEDARTPGWSKTGSGIVVPKSLT